MTLKETKTTKNENPFISIFKKSMKADELGIFVSLIAICVILSLTTKQFLSVNNLANILRQTAYIATMAVGMLFVISQGDIDLSVAAIYNLSVIILATFLEKGMNPTWVIPLGILIGGALGLINGMLMVSLKFICFNYYPGYKYYL